MALPLGLTLVVGAMGASAVVHLARPRVFEPLIPAWLGEPRPWVLGSGMVELAYAAPCADPGFSRRLAPPSAGLA